MADENNSTPEERGRLEAKLKEFKRLLGEQLRSIDTKEKALAYLKVLGENNETPRKKS